MIRFPSLVLFLTAMIIAEPAWGQFKVDGEMMYSVLPVDAIPAILDPDFLEGAKAEKVMADDEQVIGVVGPRGTAVAYSTWHLDHHEIVNDVVDGVALAVTW